MVFWDPGHTLEKRPWATPQSALWAGGNGTNGLVSIAGYHGLNKEDYITGLRFTYKSGAVQDIGDVAAGQALRSVRLSPDEDIQRMSLIKNWTGLLQVTVSDTPAWRGVSFPFAHFPPGRIWKPY